MRDSLKTPFAQALLVTALLLAFYWLGPISYYETNDDVGYDLLTSGKILANSPYAFLGAINYLLSSVFAGAYRLIPGVSWYGFFHLVSISFAVFFLNYCHALVRGAAGFLPRLMVSLATALPFMVCLQFTKTAMVLGVAGYLSLYLLSECEFASRRRLLVLYALAASLLVLSFAWRRDSFFLATLLCGPLLAGVPWARSRRLIVVLAVTAGLILTFALAHQRNFGEEWQRAGRLWSKLIGPVLDYGHYWYDDNQAVYAAAGWSRNDFNFLASWGAFDERIYSEEKIDYISKNARKKPVDRSFLPTLQAAVSLPAKNYLLTAAALALLLSLAFRRKQKRLGPLVWLPLVFCVAYLAWSGRFPPRVSTAIAFSLPWTVLVASGELRGRLFAGMVAAVAVLALAVPVYGQYQDLSALAESRKFQNQDLRRFGQAAAGERFVLITLGASFPYEGFLPFEKVDYLPGLNIVWLNSVNQSPLQKQQMADNHIDDLFGALLKRQDTFIAMHPFEAGILKRYILEHYQQNVTVTPAYSGMSFTIYRVVPSSGH